MHFLHFRSTTMSSADRALLRNSSSHHVSWSQFSRMPSVFQAALVLCIFTFFGSLNSQIEPPPPPSDENSIRSKALQRFNSAQVLENKGDAESLQQALSEYKIGLELWKLLDDSARVVETLHHLGEVCYKTSDFPAMNSYYTQALDFYQKLTDKKGEATALYKIGVALMNQNEYFDGLDSLQHALKLSRQLDDRELQAGILETIGQIYTELDDYATGVEYVEKSLVIRRALGDEKQIVNSLQNLAQAYDDKGENQKALDYFNEALQLSRKVGQRDSEAILLGQVGFVYYEFSQFETSLDYFQQCLEISKEIGHRLGEAWSIKMMGDIYRFKGDYETALQNYAISVDICRQMGVQIGVAANMSNLAMVYLAMDNTDRALDLLNESLEIHRQINSREGSGRVLNKIGDVYAHLGDFNKAIEYYQQALSVAQEIQDPALFQLTYFALGKQERKAGRTEIAREYIEEAIQLADSLRSSILNQNSRSSYFASIHGYYDELVLLLMQQHQNDHKAGYDRQALQISEKSRCRSLLEMLSIGQVDLRTGVDPALLKRERVLRRELNAKEQQRQILAKQEADSTVLAILEQESRNLLYEKEALESRILRENPRYAAMQRAEILSADKIQTDVVDGSTVLIEYALINERSFAWIISSEQINCVELPPAGDIEKAVRSVYHNLIARNERIDVESPDRRRDRIGASDEQLYASLAELSDIILAPLAKYLDKPRIVFVSDGILQYIPMAALPMPGSEKQYHPLVEKFQILSLPSASTLPLIREEKKKSIPPDKLIAVFADPVFSADDPRLKNRAPLADVSEAQPKDEALSMSLYESGLVQTRSDLSRLPFSRQEANSIIALAGKKASMCYMDFDAGYSRAISPELSYFKIIHFATHGMMNSAHPELSGLVLSLYDEQGQPQNGYLRLQDIYHMHLNADLVVLSACQTALGKNVRGEGLIGLTRGFMYAGAPRVVASLWKVDDEATAELMKLFYGNMLKKKMAPAEALQKAQIKIQKQKRWQSPYYWAAFVMQGDWQE